MTRALAVLIFVFTITGCDRDTSPPSNPDMLMRCHRDSDCPVGQRCGGQTGHEDVCAPVPSDAQGELDVEKGEQFPSGGTVYRDSSDIPMSTINISASNVRDVPLPSIQFHHRGFGWWADFGRVWIKANTADFGPIEVEGTYDQSTQILTLSFPQPIRIPAANTLRLALYANVRAKQGGGTHAFDLLRASDVLAAGNVIVTGAFPILGATITITNALTPSLTVYEDTVNARSAKVGARSVVLSQFQLDHSMPLSIKHLHAKIVSQNRNVYVVGSNGTLYFRNLRIVDSVTGTTFMGPYNPTVPASSVATGTFTLADAFTDTQRPLQLVGDLAGSEDAVGEFIDQVYFVTVGDEDTQNQEFFHADDVCQPNGSTCYGPDQIGNNKPYTVTVVVTR